MIQHTNFRFPFVHYYCSSPFLKEKGSNNHNNKRKETVKQKKTNTKGRKNMYLQEE
jgi:hypothetical protein